MDVISVTLFAAAVILMIALGLCDIFNVTLPGPLGRLQRRGLLGVVVLALLTMAAILALIVGMSPKRTRG